MRKTVVALLLVSLLIICIAGCTPAEQKYITMSTASMGGPSYATGNAITNHLNHTELSKEYKFNAIEGGGSTQNVIAIQNAEVEMATIRGGVTFDAFYSKGKYEGKEPANKLRSLFAMWPSAIQVVSLQKYNDIKSLADIKGEKVDVGERNNARELVFRSIVEKYGINYWDKNDLDASYLGYKEASDLLKNGKIVAYVASGLPPISNVVEIDTIEDIKLLPIDEDIVNELCEETGYFKPYLIPGGTYQGQQEDVLTISDFQLMVVNEDMSEELAYNIVKSIFENLPEFSKTHAAFNNIDIETAANSCTIPLHPGAEKYFKEKNVLK